MNKNRLAILVMLVISALLAACQFLPPGLSKVASPVVSTPAVPIATATTGGSPVTGAPTSAALTSTDTPPTATETAQPTMQSAALILTAKENSEKSEKPRYSITVRQPYVEWGGDPRAETFNRAVDARIQTDTQSFKDNLHQLPDEPLYTETESFLSIDFQPTNNANGILSVLLQSSFYTAGAAHPGHYSYAINFDLRDGKTLNLEDLFLPNSAYLQTISDVCIADLKARDRLDWGDGAAPKPENYLVWNITPDGLLITFDEYQVTSYAMGPQSVVVPYAVLQPYFRPSGPLAAFLKP